MNKFIGCVAICQKGIKGYITKKKSNLWIGKRLSDDGPWQSKNPTIIEKNENINKQI